MKIAWDNWDKGFTKADGTIVAPRTGTAPRPPMLVNNPGEARKYFGGAEPCWKMIGAKEVVDSEGLKEFMVWKR